MNGPDSGLLVERDGAAVTLCSASVGGVGGGFEVTFGVIISASALIGVIFAVLLTLLAPLMAVIYNAIVDVFGGLRVDLDNR